MTEFEPDKDAADDEQEDWLPQESKDKVRARQKRPDYQQVNSTCSACE